MRAYSVDLRTKILEAVDGGMTQESAARTFRVGVATIKRYLQQRRQIGTLDPKPRPGRPATLSRRYDALLWAQLEAHPDATLAEHCDRWEETQGMRVSQATMSRAIGRLGWSLKKKSLNAVERDEEQRAAWRERVAAIDPARLVFVDESGFTIAMTPRYARAPGGARARGSVPRAYGQNITLIAALSLRGIGAAMTLGGAADTSAFTAYVREILAPTVEPDQVVVLDNVTIHQGATARHLLEAKGAQVLFLPAYSSDFMPIDLAFSKIKQAVRRAQPRTREGVDTAIGEAIDTITPEDAQGYFRHCGYGPQSPSPRADLSAQTA